MLLCGFELGGCCQYTKAFLLYSVRQLVLMILKQVLPCDSVHGLSRAHRDFLPRLPPDASTAFLDVRSFANTSATHVLYDESASRPSAADKAGSPANGDTACPAIRKASTAHFKLWKGHPQLSKRYTALYGNSMDHPWRAPMSSFARSSAKSSRHLRILTSSGTSSTCPSIQIWCTTKMSSINTSRKLSPMHVSSSLA